MFKILGQYSSDDRRLLMDFLEHIVGIFTFGGILVVHVNWFKMGLYWLVV